MKYVYLTGGTETGYDWKELPFRVFSSKRKAMEFLEAQVENGNQGEWRSPENQVSDWSWVKSVGDAILHVRKQPVFTSVEDAVKGVTE